MTRALKNNIKKAILRGIAAGAHKGDLQDAVTAAVAAHRGATPRATYITIEEAVFAQRFLDSTGYVAPVGFKRDAIARDVAA